jgi:hypothetical protein
VVPHDRVSDLNAFWMARDAERGSPWPILAAGAFADYDTLKTYYVGQGGNGNTSTRFRRYVGRPGERPLLPEHDHAAADEMLVPNRWQTVTAGRRRRADPVLERRPQAVRAERRPALCARLVRPAHDAEPPAGARFRVYALAR